MLVSRLTKIARDSAVCGPTQVRLMRFGILTKAAWPQGETGAGRWITGRIGHSRRLAKCGSGKRTRGSNTRLSGRFRKGESAEHFASRENQFSRSAELPKGISKRPRIP